MHSHTGDTRPRVQQAHSDGSYFDFSGADAIGRFIEQEDWTVAAGISGFVANTRSRTDALRQRRRHVTAFRIGYLVDYAEGIEPLQPPAAGVEACGTQRRLHQPIESRPTLFLSCPSRSLIWPTPMITGIGLYFWLDIFSFSLDILLARPMPFSK